jgi:hypothetical protein
MHTYRQKVRLSIFLQEINIWMVGVILPPILITDWARG